MAEFIGAGATLAISATPIGQIFNIGLDGWTVGEVETTDLGDSWKTFLPTIAEGGTVSFDLHYDPATATIASVTTLMTTPAVVPFTLTFNDTGDATYGFSGFFTEFALSGVEVEGVVSASCKIRTTGAISITP